MTIVILVVVYLLFYKLIVPIMYKYNSCSFKHQSHIPIQVKSGWMGIWKDDKFGIKTSGELGAPNVQQIYKNTQADSN